MDGHCSIIQLVDSTQDVHNTLTPRYISREIVIHNTSPHMENTTLVNSTQKGAPSILLEE